MTANSNGTITILKSLFTRDLNKLYNEIQLYNDETTIWKTDMQIANSAGNLCLHLVGNLNTYIGKEIGNASYVRNREQEFSLKNIPREQLLSQDKATIDIVNIAFDKLNDKMLKNKYPVLVFEEKTTTGYMLTHLATHLNYHLGQINYHRRLLDELKK